MAQRRKSVALLRCAVLGVFLLGAARTTLFTVYRVAGTSMLDTLQDGDRIFVCDVPWMLGAFETGDTVVLTVHDEVLVKRIVGVPGDRIAIDRGHLVRNGQVVAEEIPGRYTLHDTLPEQSLGGNEYFVMGDNRRASVDSREFGPVGNEQLLGTVMLRMAPQGLSQVAALGHP